MIGRRGTSTTHMLACFVKVSITLVIVMKHDCVDSTIIQFPSDTMAMVNESTYFNCSTSIRPFDERNISWFHFPLDAGEDRRYIYMYDDGGIMADYRNRFAIETDLSSGAVNLLALRLELKDAGRYECRDDIQEGKGASAELTILAGALTCQTNFIRDEISCGLDPDEVRLSCSGIFHGNIHHQLEWRKAEENSSIANQTMWTSSNNITSFVALKTDLSINNQFYVCSTKASVGSRFRCYSETITLQYAFDSDARINTTIDQEITCSPNSSQMCSYNWKWFSGSDSLNVSNDQTFQPTTVGSYRCEATCDIGNKSCTVDAGFAEVFLMEEATSEENTSLLWLVILIIGIIIIIIIFIAVVCLKPRKANKSSSESNEQSAMSLMDENAENKEKMKQSRDVKGFSLFEGNPVLVSHIKREENEDKHIITGVTFFRDMLIIATSNEAAVKGYNVTTFVASNEAAVKAYNVTTFELVRRRRFAGLTLLYDIAGCHLNNSVFICGFEPTRTCKPEENVIVRLDPSLAINKKWSTGDYFGNLSVSCESNVILCVSYKNMLIEYKSDGEQIREIMLPDLVYPTHAIKLTCGQFVVSHGNKEKDTLHRVCIVDENGKVMKSSGGEKGTSLGQLNYPRYLIVDEEEEFILVVEGNSCGAVLLDMSMKLERNLFPKRAVLKNPRQMCFCWATRNLCVLEPMNEVLIFAFK